MISGKAMVCGVIGNPVGHSLSPMMHNYYGEVLKLDYIYVPCNDIRFPSDPAFR